MGINIFTLISFVFLLGLELIYFRVAEKFGILDKPNLRSSHSESVVRGGGVIFLFSILLWFYQSDFKWPWFVLAVVIIAIVSFIDDISSLNALTRFIFHLLAILLLILQLWPVQWQLYLLVIAIVVCIGTLNAFNFMDGINGITGVYSLVTLASFIVIHVWVTPFSELQLLISVSISVLIFLFFNFRKKARCFAGDVGSVTIALILIFLLLQLIKSTHNFLWPLLFLVYGTDSVITIIFRLKRRENIFQAHRTHLYQYLSNEMKIPHQTVSAIYGGAQIVINAVLIAFLPQTNYLFPVAVSIFFIIGYVLLRIKVAGSLQREAF